MVHSDQGPRIPITPAFGCLRGPAHTIRARFSRPCMFLHKAGVAVLAYPIPRRSAVRHMRFARGNPMSGLEMLTPQNSANALIDYQPAMYQGVQSHDRIVTVNNVQILAKAAKLFKIPTVISTVAASSFSGPFMPEVTELFPELPVIDRTSMNSWL